MKSNRVMLIGYVGKDLSVTAAKDRSKRVAIRIATHYARRDRQGEKVWQTVWHNVVAWDDTAAYAERNFVKGSKIMVEGLLLYRVYTDTSGQRRNVTQIKAHSLVNLDR